jgi:hypothetical protein
MDKHDRAILNIFKYYNREYYAQNESSEPNKPCEVQIFSTLAKSSSESHSQSNHSRLQSPKSQKKILLPPNLNPSNSINHIINDELKNNFISQTNSHVENNNLKNNETSYYTSKFQDLIDYNNNFFTELSSFSNYEQNKKKVYSFINDSGIKNGEFKHLLKIKYTRDLLQLEKKLFDFNKIGNAQQNNFVKLILNFNSQESSKTIN